MNKQGSQVVGTNVKSTRDQKQIGKVKALVIDQQNHKVSGLLINDDPLFSSQVVPIDQVKDIKEEVEIETSDQVQRAHDIFTEPKNDTDETEKFVEKTKVKTPDGVEMGTVKDFKFNIQTGEIEEYIVKTSDGKDITIKKGDITALDQTSITVDKQIIEQQKTSSEAPPAEEKSGMKKGITGIFDSITGGLDKLTTNKKEEEMVGKYVTKNILTKADTVFARRGDVITHELVERAKKEKLSEQMKKFSSEKPETP